MAVDTPNLYEYALERVRQSAQARELPRVCDETGLGMSWMSKFARGKIPGASYEKVHTLASYYQQREARPQ